MREMITFFKKDYKTISKDKQYQVPILVMFIVDFDEIWIAAKDLFRKYNISKASWKNVRRVITDTYQKNLKNSYLDYQERVLL